jgi:hypothetical protein
MVPEADGMAATMEERPATAAKAMVVNFILNGMGIYKLRLMNPSE